MEEVHEADSSQRRPAEAAGQEQQNEHVPSSSAQPTAAQYGAVVSELATLTIVVNDLRAYVQAQQAASKDSESNLHAQIHALQQQLARRTAAEVLSSPAPPTSAPSHNAPSSRPATASRPASSNAAPVATRPPADTLPPPPTRTMPQAKPATKELFLQLPATSQAGATTAQLEALFTSQAHVPCSVRVLPPRRSRASPRGSEEDSPESVQAMAALGLVMVPQQRREGGLPPAADTLEDTRQRFIITFAMESERSVWGSYSKLRRLGLIFHDNLSPEQQRRKAAQKGVADNLRASGPIRWDYDQLSKLANGRWVSVPFTLQ